MCASFQTRSTPPARPNFNGSPQPLAAPRSEKLHDTPCPQWRTTMRVSCTNYASVSTGRQRAKASCDRQSGCRNKRFFFSFSKAPFAFKTNAYDYNAVLRATQWNMREAAVEGYTGEYKFHLHRQRFLKARRYPLRTSVLPHRPHPRHNAVTVTAR